MMMMMRLRDRRVVKKRERSVCLSSALRCRRLLRVAAATGTAAAAADRSYPPPRDRSWHPSGATHILPAPFANLLPLLRHRHHGDHPS